MKTRMHVSLLLCAIAVAGCAKPAEAPAVPAASAAMDAAAMKDTIQAREKQWSAAFQAGDAAAVGMMYLEDGASVQPAGEWQRGRAAIVEGIKKQLDTITVSTREDIPEEVIPLGDQLVEIGHFSYAGTTKVGNKPVSGAGRYMVIWRKDTDGQWRIQRDIGNEAPKK
ncbi:MAG: SgcJ/EcaC family oxidoreductase [Gemmatimonas sp.]